MDGFLLAGTNDDYAIGFYGESERPFYNALATAYTTFDAFFSPILAETYPNRIFMHAAQTDRLTNTLALSSLRTIWDRLIAKGVSARYYYSDVSFLSLVAVPAGLSFSGARRRGRPWGSHLARAGGIAKVMACFDPRGQADKPRCAHA